MVFACVFVFAGCSHQTAYGRYTAYLSRMSDRYQNLLPLPQDTVTQLAASPCAQDDATVTSTVQLMTETLPNRYDTQAIGNLASRPDPKAYCKNWPHATFTFPEQSAACSGRPPSIQSRNKRADIVKRVPMRS